MSNPFDASQIWSEPVGAETLAEQSRTVEHLMLMPSALANAMLHAQNEMQRLINACNRTAWGSVPSELRPPEPSETAALLEGLSAEHREKLMRDARLAAEQRALLSLMKEAHEHYLAQLQKEQDELAHRQQAAAEWAEFDAHDTAEKQKRFEAWRASRRV